MKKFHFFINFLPFIGVIFAALYFYQIHPRLNTHHPNYPILLSSYIILILAFISRSALWYFILIRFDIHVQFRIAFVSQFRSILMKYIPGKIWVIVGRANLVSQYGYSLKYCSFLSSLMQFIMIISGLFIGLLGLLLFNFHFISFYFILIFIFLIFFIMLFISCGFTIPELKLKSFFRFLQPLMGQKIPPMFHVILFSLFHWILMGFSFFLFIKSIYYKISLYPILLQPLAINIGIISPFSPSGLGVREGVMIGYLALGGMPLASATNISLSARLWFFLAELLFFLAGWLFQKKREPEHRKEV